MRHQRPSSAKRGAASCQVAGSSTRGGCIGGGVAHAASTTTSRSDLRIALLLRPVAGLRVRRMVEAVLRLAMRDAGRMADLVADFLGAARLAQPARREQLE